MEKQKHGERKIIVKVSLVFSLIFEKIYSYYKQLFV